MAIARIYKGMPVVFNHDEFGWIQGTAMRPSPNGEEWLVRVRGDERWIAPRELYEVGKQPTGH